MPLFDRNVELAIGPEGEEGRAWRGEDFRIGWNVEHKRNSKPSTATVDFYNPDENTIDYIRSGRKVVRMKVGYRAPVQIFIGFIEDGSVRVDFSSGDRKLSLKGTDKAYEGQKKHVDTVIPSGTQIDEAIKQIAKENNVPTGRLNFGTDPPKLNASAVFSESVDEAIQKLADRAGVTVWTKNGALVAAPPSTSPRKTTVVNFSQEQGTLFNVEPKKKGRVQFNMLLKPQIRPGDLFNVEHDRYGGAWRARDVTFEGDSGWESTYKVQITAESR